MSLIAKFSAVGLIFLLTSCAKTTYLGSSHQATDVVDVFFDERNITVEYEVIGRAIGEGHRIKKVKSKLIDRAKEEGANAILISAIEVDNYAVNGSVAPAVGSIDQVKATFIRYK